MKTVADISCQRGLNIRYRGQDGFAGTLDYNGVRLQLIFSWGGKWEHASVSLPQRCPTWEEMSYVKNGLWQEEECVIQYHPPKSEYVNNAPFCLHLWRPQNETIPLPPKEMVGIKDADAKTMQQEARKYQQALRRRQE